LDSELFLEVSGRDNVCGGLSFDEERSPHALSLASGPFAGFFFWSRTWVEPAIGGSFAPASLCRAIKRACTLATSGFFTLRPPVPWLYPSGTLEATSFHETQLLKSTLERLVDFDRINASNIRFSVKPIHTMASLWTSLPAARFNSLPYLVHRFKDCTNRYCTNEQYQQCKRNH
jgi:hypothetical protein